MTPARETRNNSGRCTLRSGPANHDDRGGRNPIIRETAIAYDVYCPDRNALKETNRVSLTFSPESLGR